MLTGNREMNNLVEDLLYKCGKSQNSPLSTPTGECPWQVFESIFEAVEKVLEKQRSTQKYAASSETFSFEKFMSEERKIDEFKQWMVQASNNNCGLNKYIDLELNTEKSVGLVTCSEIQQDEKVLTIPRKCLIVDECNETLELESSSDETKNILKSLFSSSKNLFTEVPSLRLTMVLLFEMFENGSKSNWFHYINVLPRNYSMLLYFSKSTFKSLHAGSACGELVLSLFRNISRQYCLIFKNLEKLAPQSNLANSFSFEAFRWAVCTVMSRQNKLPLKKFSNGVAREQDELALIPLWDLANHKQSHMTTFYNSETDCVECLATEKLELGANFEIHYGNRTNSSFMIYQGFVPDNNIHNQVSITLGISSSDVLCRTKSQILLDHQIPSCGKFSLYTAYHEIPFTRDLLIFLRVFNLDKDDLGLVMIQKELAGKRLLGNLMWAVSQSHEAKTWKFLSTRCLLLQMKAKKSVSQTQSTVEDENVTDTDKREANLVLKLLQSELEVFENVQKFAERMLKTVQSEPAAFTFLDS